jgi:hypothetical protein
VSEEQLQEFKKLLVQMQKEESMTATIRHQLGGGLPQTQAKTE